MQKVILIKNATVITPYETIEKGEILLSGGKIQQVARKDTIRQVAGAVVIDARSDIVAPGFIDVHVQGAGGADVLDGTKKALKTMAKTLAKNGTTSFLATTVVTGKNSAHISLIDKVIREGTGGANILGIHLEGPYINPLRKGMIRDENIKNASKRDIRRILRLCRGRLAMMTLAPEMKGVFDIIPVLKKKGVIASFGHSNANYEETRKGLKKGITHVTHIFNAMPQLHHRHPGPLSAIFEDENCSMQLIADGAHVHPSVIKLLIKIVGMDRIVLITDSMSSTGLKDGSYVYNGLDYTSRGGIARYGDGTLIGTSLALLQMVERIRRIAGISLNEAIKAASLNPAELLGIEYRKGSITQGKDADVIIIDRRFHVKRVIIGGKVIF